MMHFPVPADAFSNLAPVLQLRILIIDDNAFDRKWLTRMLRQTGILVDVAEANTLAAMNLALEGARFDIVFLDCFMPGSTLDEALASLSDKSSDTVLITGSAAPRDLLRNGYSVMQKSFVSEEMLASRLLLCASDDITTPHNPVTSTVRAAAPTLH